VSPDDRSATSMARGDPEAGTTGALDVDGRRAVLAKVRDEIDAEVALRRSSGSVPADLEQRLDEAFSELSPGEGSDYLIRQALEVVDRRAAVAPQVPVASERPGGSFFKRMIRAAVGWYVRFFVAQLTSFAVAVARALHLLAEDLEDLRNETSTQRPPLADGLAVNRASDDLWWMPLAVSAFSDASAPVMCGDIADFATLRALRDAGVDAYGVRDSGDSSGTRAGEGLDVRNEGLLDHARTLVQGAVGGALLEGSIQWIGPRRADELLGTLEPNMAEGTVLMVVSSTPQAWSRLRDPVLADLAPGRPLHPETWVHLMQRHGFAEPRLHRGGPDLAAKWRTSSSGSTPLDQALGSVMESLLGGPDEYAVIAARGAGTR